METDSLFRYIVCEGLCKAPASLIEHLLRVNDQINTFKAAGEKEDVIELVPLEILDKTFCHYMRRSNDVLAQKQTFALKKLHKFLRVTLAD